MLNFRCAVLVSVVLAFGPGGCKATREQASSRLAPAEAPAKKVTESELLQEPMRAKVFFFVEAFLGGRKEVSRTSQPKTGVTAEGDSASIQREVVKTCLEGNLSLPEGACRYVSAIYAREFEPLEEAGRIPAQSRSSVQTMKWAMDWLGYLASPTLRKGDVDAEILPAGGASRSTTDEELVQYFSELVVKYMASDIEDDGFYLEEDYSKKVQQILGLKLDLKAGQKRTADSEEAPPRDKQKEIAILRQAVRKHFRGKGIDRMKSFAYDCLNERLEGIVGVISREEITATSARSNWEPGQTMTYGQMRGFAISPGVIDKAQQQGKEVLAELAMLADYHLPLKYARVYKDYLN